MPDLAVLRIHNGNPKNSVRPNLKYLGKSIAIYKVKGKVERVRDVP